MHFNPFAPGFVDDPYPHYAQLREQNPVEEHPMGLWFLWRYRDAERVTRTGRSVDERALNVSALTPAYREASGGRLPRANGLALMDVDPPDHTRLRGMLTPSFTGRMVERLERRVREVVTQGLDRMAEQGGGELIKDLAFPLPFTIITELVGMPIEGSDRVRQLSDTIVMSMEPVVDPSAVARIVAADDEMVAIISEVIARKRKNPADDLLTAMIAAADADPPVLSADELAAQVMVLFLAGHETTVNLIGNGTLALAGHPDQFAALHANPALAGNAVEELLRFDAPVQLGRRITTEPTEIDGHVIPPATFVSPAMGAGNRDPEFWGPDADRVRLDRPNAREHLSFGGGVRHCLGANLARLEGRIFFEELGRRFRTLEVDGAPTRNGLINLRGLAALPLALTPA
jgi:cytochrome P450